MLKKYQEEPELVAEETRVINSIEDLTVKETGDVNDILRKVTTELIADKIELDELSDIIKGRALKVIDGNSRIDNFKDFIESFR